MIILVAAFVLAGMVAVPIAVGWALSEILEDIDNPPFLNICVALVVGFNVSTFFFLVCPYLRGLVISQI